MVKANVINNGNSIRLVPFNEEEPYIELTEEQVDLFMTGRLKLRNGIIVDNTLNLEMSKRVDELKQLLKDSDYKTLKYAEGEISLQEFESIKAQRKAWRDEINDLEAKIKS